MTTYKNLQIRILKFAQSFGGILLINTLICVLLFSLSLVRYEENDDIVMCLISQGLGGGEPSPYLVFINYFYGLFLVLLYKISASVEWYTLMFCVLHIISFSIILYYIIKSTTNKITKLLFIILFYGLEITFITLLQFTTTAAIVTFAGFMLVSFATDKKKLLGVFLLIVGSLIRFEAAMLVLVFSIPIMFLLSNSLKKYRYNIVLLAAGIIGIISFKIADSYMYSLDKDWSYYMQYNKVRGKINDNPNNFLLTNNYTIADKVSFNDYRSVVGFFPDGEKINLEKLLIIQQALDNQSFFLKAKHGFYTTRGFTKYIFLILLMLGIVAFSKKLPFSKIMLLGMYFCMFIGSMWFISLNGYVKKRVFFSMLIPVFFFLYSIKQSNKHTWLQYAYWGLLVVCIYSVYIGLYQNKQYTNSKADQIASQLNLINSYAEKNPQAQIIPLVGTFSYEFAAKPFTIKKTLQHVTLRGGWLTNIPLNNPIIDSRTVFVNETERENVVIFTAYSDKKDIDQLIHSFKETLAVDYNMIVKGELLMRNKKYAIFKLTRQNDYNF